MAPLNTQSFNMTIFIRPNVPMWFSCHFCGTVSIEAVTRKCLCKSECWRSHWIYCHGFHLVILRHGFWIYKILCNLEDSKNRYLYMFSNAHMRQHYKIKHTYNDIEVWNTVIILNTSTKFHEERCDRRQKKEAGWEWIVR